MRLFFAGGKGTKSFVDRCISYVGENASECVKTNSFLNLSKDALIKLISSDYVSPGHYVFQLNIIHVIIIFLYLKNVVVYEQF